VLDHRNFALLGLFPGLVSTRSVANLGQFEFEIIIEPEVPSLGGGAYLSPAPTKYILTIRVSRKGKTWELKSKISNVTAKVIAKFMRRELPEVNITNVSVTPQETPQVEVKHASTTKIR
jgi:hypothetical protein